MPSRYRFTRIKKSKSGKRVLYPEIKTYNDFMLKVSDLHTIYVEECGNPNGNPVIVFQLLLVLELNQLHAI